MPYIWHFAGLMASPPNFCSCISKAPIAPNLSAAAKLAKSAGASQKIAVGDFDDEPIRAPESVFVSSVSIEPNCPDFEHDQRDMTKDPSAEVLKQNDAERMR